MQKVYKEEITEKKLNIWWNITAITRWRQNMKVAIRMTDLSCSFRLKRSIKPINKNCTN